MLNSGLRKLKRIKGRLNKKALNVISEENEVDDEIVDVPKRREDAQDKDQLSTNKKKKKDTHQESMDITAQTTNYGTENTEDGDLEENKEDLSYEDMYDDEWEEEEVVNQGEAEDSIEESFEENKWNEEETEQDFEGESLSHKFSELKFSDEPVILLDEKNTDRRAKKNEDGLKAFMGTSQNLKEGECLEFENQAYDIFHRAKTPWPCLSLDILVPKHKKNIIPSPNKLEIKQYPLTIYVIAGSQAPSKTDNAIYCMKWSSLHKTRYDDDSDVLDEEDIDNDEDPKLDILSIAHAEPINRIRSMNGTGVVALWDESGKVSIYDTSRHIQKLVEYNENEEEIIDDEGPNPTPQGLQPPKDPLKRNFLVNSFQHSSEGYALQWCPTTLGLFASGGCDRRIYLYRPADENGSSWNMDTPPYTVHGGSVEDIQFAPNDPNLVASCSTDRTIKFTDLRCMYRNECQSHIDAGETDINVISWSTVSPNLIASGSDDGTIQVWDIRYIQKARSVVNIQFHTSPITSIEFQPFEDSVITTASADNRVTVWDFSVEADSSNKDDEIPDQLMFMHQGVEDVKEIRHHSYMSDLILCTSANGFNVFKPNYEEDFEEENN